MNQEKKFNTLKNNYLYNKQINKMAIEKFQEKFIQIIIPIFEGSIEDRKKLFTPTF